MDSVDALHTAVRLACEEREDECWGRAEYDRWHAAEAIRVGVEAFTPRDLGSLAEARELLAATAETADSEHTRRVQTAEGLAAIADERARLASFARDVDEAALEAVEPMPFRRTVTTAESRQLWGELERRWGVTSRCWYPLSAAQPEHTVAFGNAPFDDAGLQQTLRDVLANLGAPRVLELREYDQDIEEKEIDLELFLPYYASGGEGFWFDRSFAWLIYASHEESVTIGGHELLPRLQAAWPEWHDYLYDYPH